MSPLRPTLLLAAVCAAIASQTDHPFFGRDSNGNILVEPAAGRTAIVAGVDVQALERLTLQAAADLDAASSAQLQEELGALAFAVRLRQARRLARRQNILVAAVGQGDEDQRSVYGFVSRSAEWLQLPPLPHPRSAGSMISFRDQFFIIGGYLEGGIPSTLAFDGMSWNPMPSMTHPRIFFGAVV